MDWRPREKSARRCPPRLLSSTQFTILLKPHWRRHRLVWHACSLRRAADKD